MFHVWTDRGYELKYNPKMEFLQGTTRKKQKQLNIYRDLIHLWLALYKAAIFVNWSWTLLENIQSYKLCSHGPNLLEDAAHSFPLKSPKAM